MPHAIVIDDSKAVRLILTNILKKLGYQVRTAGDGGEALKLLAETSPDLDLMLVDWNMPVVDGLEFVKRVRAMPLYAGVPMIMVTTETEVSHVVQALDAGATEYVMKPFTEDIIAEKLSLIGAPI